MLLAVRCFEMSSSERVACCTVVPATNTGSMVARGVRVAVRGVLFVAGEVVADEEANSEDEANCRYVQHPPSGAKEVEGFRELHG